MRRATKIGSMFGAALLGASIAHGDTTTTPAKWYDSIAASGYLQTSYVGNLENSAANPGNQGRQFDTRGNSFSLNTFLLQIAKPVGDDHYGFTARLRTGQDAAALNTATGSNGGNFAVQEAYLTYVLPALSKLSFIGGRFVTPEGYEGVDTVNNPNFSEGLLFTFAEPINHTGVKAVFAFSEKMSAMVGVVNGWNVDTDNNNAKTIIWQFTLAPSKTFSWNLQGTHGKELASDPSHSSLTSVDSVATLTLGKLSLAGQLNWGQQTHDPNTANAEGTTHWSGAGVWATFAMTEKMSTSARFEVMGDQDNANRFGTLPGGGSFADGTKNQTVKDITLTQKYMFTPAMGMRGEFRHDWSNQAYFKRKDGTAVTNQNTISADWFVTF